MRLIELSTHYTVIIDIVVWFIIHMSVTHFMLRMPKKYFDCGQWLYRERRWEDSGVFYLRKFRVKKWKQYLPDGADFSNNKGFQKRHLKSRDVDYLAVFSIETCRAELTHWITMVFALVFFLWNSFYVGCIMIVYACAANLPCIIVQRYNRIRLRRVINLGTDQASAHSA